MIDRTYDNMTVRRHPMDGDSVRLGPPGCKDQVLRPATEPAGDSFARILHNPSCSTAGPMNRGWISGDLERGENGGKGRWPQLLGRVGIQVVHVTQLPRG